MRIQAELRGVVLADSTDTIVVGGKHYFPPQDVLTRHLRPAGLRLSLRGTAARFDVCLDDARAEDAAWCLARPWWSRRVRGRIAFADPVVVDPVTDA